MGGSRRARSGRAGGRFLIRGALAALAAASTLAPSAPPSPAAADPVARVTEALAARGFENVVVQTAGTSLTVWYENRVLRDELAAMGEVARLVLDQAGPARTLRLVPESYGVPTLSVRAAAADWRAFLEGRAGAEWFRGRVEVLAADGAPSARAVPGPRTHASTGRFDLRLRPLFDFELGIADDPFRSSSRVAVEAVGCLLPGTVLTLQLPVRVHDSLDSSTPRIAPGRNTLSWGGWLPGGLLGTASGGLFAGDRWGFGGEIGRLAAEGAFELRAGADWTGLLDFNRDVTFYSSLDAWSGFVALTHRPEEVDLEATVAVARFLDGDPGVRVDLDRRFQESELGFFVIDTRVDTVLGVTLRLPLPAARLPRPSPVRLATVPEFPFEYRESLNEIGQQARPHDDLDRLRKRLYPTWVRNQVGRMVDPAGQPVLQHRKAAPAPGATLHGMTGLVIVPTAAVLPDGAIRFGAGFVEREWAYQGRDDMDNEVWFLAVGFLPRVEASIRATVLPELSLLEGQEAPAVDRLASARVLLLEERGLRPAVAAGIDDVRGTRLYHSLYLVGTKSFRVGPPTFRATLGYGADPIQANLHVLRGVFGGVEAEVGPWARALLDFDTEKWNSGVALTAFGRLSAQFVLLHLDTPSGALAWTHRF
ncbi:MAG: YjbH domain-containing protein [Candidatus Eiseniibacteriota bacterium]